MILSAKVTFAIDYGLLQQLITSQQEREYQDEMVYQQRRAIQEQQKQTELLEKQLKIRQLELELEIEKRKEANKPWYEKVFK